MLLLCFNIDLTHAEALMKEMIASNVIPFATVPRFRSSNKSEKVLSDLHQ